MRNCYSLQGQTKRGDVVWFCFLIAKESIYTVFHPLVVEVSRVKRMKDGVVGRRSSASSQNKYKTGVPRMISEIGLFVDC